MTDHHLRCEESCRLSPTTTPVKALPANETSLRFTEVPLVWSIQVSPESVLLRSLPAQPTANLVSVLENQCPTSPDRRATLTNSFRRQLFLKWRLTDPPSRNQAAIFFAG